MPKSREMLSIIGRVRPAVWMGFGLLLTLAPAGVAQPVSDAALVERFFPQRLLDDFAHMYPDRVPVKEWAFGAADLNGTGTPEFLIVVYSTGSVMTLSTVQVLRKQGDSAVLISEPACKLYGARPEIVPIDLDHSGRPQFLVQTSSGPHGLSKVVFRWNGTALELLGPFATDPEDGARHPVLMDAQFLDLDGDGVIEAVNSPDILPIGPDANPHTYEVYKLVVCGEQINHYPARRGRA